VLRPIAVAAVAALLCNASPASAQHVTDLQPSGVTVAGVAASSGTSAAQTALPSGWPIMGNVKLPLHASFEHRPSSYRVCEDHETTRSCALGSALLPFLASRRPAGSRALQPSSV